MYTDFFERGFIEITLPLTDNIIEKISQTNYGYIFNDLYNTAENPAYGDAWCELRIAFDVINNIINFIVITFRTLADDEVGLEQMEEIVDFPEDVAEILRDAALQAIVRNLADMTQCKADVTNSSVR